MSSIIYDTRRSGESVYSDEKPIGNILQQDLFGNFILTTGQIINPKDEGIVWFIKPEIVVPVDDIPIEEKFIWRLCVNQYVPNKLNKACTNYDCFTAFKIFQVSSRHNLC